MKKWQKIYLVKLYYTNKGIAIFVFLFLIINLSANLIVPTQITPIYNWNLYAYPLHNQDTYNITTVIYNGNKELKFEHTWKEPQKMLLMNTLNLYIANKIDGSKDYSQKHFQENWIPSHQMFQKRITHFTNFPVESEFQPFPKWFFRYLEQVTGQQIDSIKIIRRAVAFKENGIVSEIDSKPLFTIP